MILIKATNAAAEVQDDDWFFEEPCGCPICTAENPEEYAKFYNYYYGGGWERDFPDGLPP